MRQNDALENLVNGAFGEGLAQFADDKPKGSVRQVRETPEVKVPATKKVSGKKLEAVEKAQNANRGRGKKIEGRAMVSFKTPVRIADAIQQIHFDTGKTLTNLYEEALLDLIAKYGRKA